MKAELKKAKEAIGAKDYALAIRILESAMSEGGASESERFNGLLLLGLASQNTRSWDRAENCFREAATLQPQSQYPLNALVGLFEAANDSDALRLSLKTLRSVLLQGSPAVDAKKHAQVAHKLFVLVDADRDWAECINLLDSLFTLVSLPSSESNNQQSIIESLLSAFNCTNAASLKLLFLEKLVVAQETLDQETIETEIEVRRRRLGAADLATTTKAVELEVLTRSKLHLYYDLLLSLLPSNSQKTIEIQEKLLDSLLRRIKYTANSSDKFGTMSKIRSLSESLVQSGSMSPSPYQLLLDIQDSSWDAVDLELIKKTNDMVPNVAIGYSASGYLKWFSPESSIDDALEDLSSSIDMNPNSVFANHIISAIYNKAKDYDSCIVFCKKSLEIISQFSIDTGTDLPMTHISILLLLGDAYCKLGAKFHTDAVKVFTEVLERDAANLIAMQGLSTTYFTVEKYQESLSILKDIVARNSGNDVAISDMAWVYYKQGDLQTASKLIQEAIALKDCAAYCFRFGKILWDSDSRHESYTQFLKSVKQDPSLPGVFTAIGIYCLLEDSNPTRAKKCFAKAVQIDPFDEEAILELVKLQLEDGEVEEAKAELMEFIERSGRSAGVWRYLGFISLKQEEFYEASTQFQASLRLDLRSVASWEGLGEAYAHEGKYMAALKAFKRAHELNETNFSPVYQSGLVRIKLGLYSEAIVDLTSVKKALRGEISNNGIPGACLPCLKSLADVYLLSARESFSIGAYGVVMDRLNSAILECIEFVKYNNTYQSVFKTLGDACVSIYIYRSKHSRLIDVALLRRGLELISGGVVNVPDSLAESACSLALYLAISAYKMAIHICNINNYESALASSYLHDLSLTYYYLHQFQTSICTTSGPVEDEYLRFCIMSVWKAIQLDPNNETFWNSLGVFAFKSNYKISQHALIKALEFDEKVTDAWLNLGFFYYFSEDFELSKQCFIRAQLIDPESSLSWFGQAIINSSNINTTIDPTNLDLYDHANELSQGQFLEISYSYALSEYQRKCVQDSSAMASSGGQDNSNARLELVNPVFSMLKFCEICADDASGFNLLGLLQEKQGCFEQSVNSFKTAVDLSLRVKGEKGNAMTLDCLVNHARSLCSAQMYEESIEVYTKVFELTQGDALMHVGFGIALFFNGQLEQSLGSFQNALNMIAGGDDEDPRHVLLQNKVGLLLSQVLYALGSEIHLGLARDQLLECIQRPGGFPRAIISLLALGIVSQNHDLSQAAAAQLLMETPETLIGLETDCNLILSRYFLLQGSSKLSRGFIAKNIHHTPWKASNWLLLSEGIARYAPEIVNPLATCAMSASILETYIPAAHIINNRTSAVTTAVEKCLIHQSLGSAFALRGHCSSLARSHLHSAVRANPTDPQAWILLGISIKASMQTAVYTELGQDHDLRESVVQKIKAGADVCQNAAALVRARTANDLDKETGRMLLLGWWSRIILTEYKIGASLVGLVSGNDQGVVQRLQECIQETEELRMRGGDCGDARVVAMGYVLAARSLIGLGEYETALGTYRNALTVCSDLINVWEELGEAYANAARFTQAIICFTHALSIAGSNASKRMLQTRLSKVYFASGNNSEGATALAQLKMEEGVLEGNARFLDCIGMIKSGNAGALAKCKKIITSVIEEEGDGVFQWAVWIRALF